MKRIRIKMGRISKIYYILALFLIVGVLSVTIPSLARYKNRVTITDTPVWDGTIATSYKKGSGSKSDPYVISTGAELAYFSTMLSTTNYKDTYFTLNNDIILNEGVFKYTLENGITYITNDKTGYLKEYTNEVYNDQSKSTLSDIKVNIFNPISNFKGHFDGNAYTIYGLYISNNESEELGLFTNLEGEVKDLYVKNSIIYGGNITGGIASSATETTMKNLVYDGYVIGKNDVKEKSLEIALEDQIHKTEDSNTPKEIDISSELNNINSLTSSIKISGSCTSDLTTGNISINNVLIPNCDNNTFEIELDNFPTNKLTIDTKDSDLTTYQLTNLKYIVTYNTGIAAGIVASATNLTLENIINKATITSTTIAAGLIANSKGNLKLNQSYNTGNINSTNLSAGLVGNINNTEGNIIISKSYNSGIPTANLKAGVIGIINEVTTPVNIVDTFQTTTDYSIDTVKNTNVSIINSYKTSGSSIKTGTTSGEFVTATIPEIKTNISFKNYTNQENLNSNPNNVWVLDKSTLPVLFTDDILESKVNINVSNQSWNNLSYELETYYYSNNLTFNIEEKSSTSPVQDIYYYISNKKLTQEELTAITEWTKFENITTIKEEGNYVIYAKAVDYNGTINYINTDLLVLDNTAPTIEMTFNNYKWNTLESTLNTIYISKEESFKLTAADTSSKIKDLKYYITDKVLTEEELTTQAEDKWLDYKDSIIISNKGTSIIYVKATDNAGNKTYISSDYIIYGGYEQTKMYLGENEVNNIPSAAITSKSTISFTYDYENIADYKEKYTHNLVTNILLPEKTKITIKDNIKNKVYTYEIENNKDLYNYQDSCKDKTECEKKATYPFSLFKEIGTATNEIAYKEENKDNNKESFKIILDFSKTNITTTTENIYASLEILDDSNNIVRSTLKDTIKYFSLYPNNSGEILINSNYTSSIVYNSDSINEIEIQSGIEYKMVDNIQIIDTTLQDKIMGLAIKLVDNNNEIVDKKFLKNLEFQVGNKTYSPDTDGIVRINLENKNNSINTSLKIITNKDDLTLKDGNYHFIISSYLSNDGEYATNCSNNSISIPVIYEKDYKISTYNFDVIASDDSKILSKEKENTPISFKILENGTFTNPNIRVSLYQKENLTAYNQKYSLLNLKDYTTDNLTQALTNIYYVTQNPISFQKGSETYNQFDLNLLTSKLSTGGYKLLFELYDGVEKVGEIPHKFIIK